VRLACAYARSLCHDDHEVPPGSNRGPFPDHVAREFGSPLGSAWCALAAGHLRAWAGLATPPRPLVGSCDAWRDWAEDTGRWVSAGALVGPRARLTLATAPALSVVLYTTWQLLTDGPYRGRYDAVHAGVLLEPARAGGSRSNWEGNTSADRFDRNGGAAAVKPVHRTWFYGLVLPHPLAPASAGSAPRA